MKYQPESTVERPFEFSCMGITNDDIAKGKEEYIKWGKPGGNSVEITPATIMGKARMFASMKLRGVRAPEFERVVGMMLASRKYFMSHQWAYAHAALDMDYTRLVWKNMTAPESFTGEDLGNLLYGRKNYRYHSTAPERDLVPLVQRDDFYDAKESWGEDAEVFGDGFFEGGEEENEEVFATPQEDISPTPHDDDALPTAAGVGPDTRAVWKQCQDVFGRLPARDIVPNNMPGPEIDVIPTNV